MMIIIISIMTITTIITKIIIAKCIKIPSMRWI